MARETNCPICQKLLIGGQCRDCGYYADTDSLVSNVSNPDINAGHLCESHNGGSAYNTYKADAGHLCESHNGEPSLRTFSAKERDAVDMTKSDRQIANEKSLFVLGIILTVMFPLWGYIISLIILNSNKSNPKYKKKLSVVFGVVMALYVLMYVGEAVLSELA